MQPLVAKADPIRGRLVQMTKGKGKTSGGVDNLLSDRILWNGTI
jgi:hypothetical protein